MKIINILMTATLMMGGLHLHAQTVGVEYTTELQTNFRESNFVNLLRLNAEMPIGKSFSLEAATISIAKTRKERLVDDFQTFSNIEEENLPLAISVCDVNWQINDEHALFVGIRNMNEDYFTSPITSFFTNSSCGVYPTISANYDIASYPVASVSIHYKFEKEIRSNGSLVAQASLYNGTGYNRFTGRENVFRFCPKDDGIFGIAEVSYSKGNSFYSLGNAIHANEDVGTTPWLYAEQGITENLSLIAGYSHAFGRGIDCRDFAGVGAHYQLKKCELGVFTDFARFSEGNEYATEITCKAQLTPHIFLQPIVHLIATPSSTDSKTAFHSVATIRLGITI